MHGRKRGGRPCEAGSGCRIELDISTPTRRSRPSRPHAGTILRHHADLTTTTAAGRLGQVLLQRHESARKRAEEGRALTGAQDRVELRTAVRVRAGPQAEADALLAEGRSRARALRRSRGPIRDEITFYGSLSSPHWTRRCRMLHARRLVILVPPALLTESCQATQSQSAPLPLPQEPGIEWVALQPDLPQSLRDSVRFGYLEVPEDHDAPGGPRITARRKTTARRTRRSVRFFVSVRRAECRTAYPRLEADNDSVLAAIRREPVRVEVPATVVAEDEILMNEEFLRTALSQFLVNRDRAARLPSIIHSLAQNGFGELSRVLSQVVGGRGEGGRPEGHMWTAACAPHMATVFFEAPERAPDTTCVASIPPLEFVTVMERPQNPPR